MSHITCTRGNWGNSRLLVIRSQIVNLIPCPSFGHNLCLKCPNGSCKPISNIYIPRSFQWYNERFNSLNFDPCNHSLKIWQSIWDSQDESSLGSVRVHSLTLFCILGNMRCDSQASLLVHTLASPCLSHEPKVRVITKCMVLLTSIELICR
jgi:hypothetical protein